MSRKQVSVLLIEESSADARRIETMLAGARGLQCHLETTSAVSAGLTRIAAGGIELLLLGAPHTERSVAEKVRSLRERIPEALPIVVISGLDDEQVAFEAVQAGAQDYLLKGQMTAADLGRAIRFSIERQRAGQALREARAEVERAQKSLRGSQRVLWEKSQMLRLVLDHMPAFVFWKDRNSVYLGCNYRFAENAGLKSSEEILGLTDLDLPWKATEAESYRIDDRAVMQTGAPKLNYEETQFTADGRLTYVRTSKIPLKSQEGRVIGILGTFEDITERKHAEQMLAEAEAKYRCLVEESLVGVYLIQQGKFAYANSCMAGIFGYSQDELIGKLIVELAAPEDRETVAGNVQKRELGQVQSMQYAFRGLRKDGQLIDVEVMGTRTVFNGQPAVIGSLLDVTERKRAEVALRRINRELRAISDCNQTLLRATNEQTLLEEVCRIVCEEAGYRMAWVGYAEHDEVKSVRPAAWAGVDAGYLEQAKVSWGDTERGRGPTGSTIRTGKSHYIKDFATDPEAAPWRESALEHGFRSSIALPLNDEQGVTFGTLTILSGEANAFTPEEFRLLEELAGDLAFGITALRSRVERKRAEQEIAQLSFALSNVREGVLLTDSNGSFRYVNKEMLHLLGYAREELLRLSVADIDPEFPATRWLQHWEELKTQGSLSLETYHRRKDGSTFPVEVSANYFEYGGVGYNLALVRDISERKRAEEERLANLNFFESMARVNKVMQKTSDFEQGIGEVLNEVLSIFDCDRAWLIYPCDPDAPELRVVIQRTRSEYKTPIAPGEALPLDQSGRAALRRIMESTAPVSFGSGLECPLPAGIDAEPHGVKSQIATVLRPKGDKPYVFGLHQCSHVRAWTRGERRLLQEIGRRLTDYLTSLLAYRNLRDSERRLGEAQRIAQLGSWDCDLEKNLVTFSDEFFRIYGIPTDKRMRDLIEWREQWLTMVHPNDRERVDQVVDAAFEGKTPYDIEYRLIRPDGEERVVRVIAELAKDSTGKPRRMFGTTQDITERKRAEEEQARLRQHLQQAQKMEVVGQLAGGIAHDFNNVLTIINGYSELLLRNPAPPDVTKTRVEEIVAAGERAAALTRQLLAFSRKLVLQPKVLNLNTIISGFEKMLRRLLGEEIEIRTLLDTRLKMVKADPSQMEQIILNLCVNARDAMPEGGVLTIETSNVGAGEGGASLEHLGISARSYVRIMVSDTGIGMDSETLSHIFEPFFTTKGPERGTGLGLATVYGIVKQSGGHVSATSEPGRGTTFYVFLPVCETGEEPGAESRVGVSPRSKRGSETVLLVEDSEPLRALFKKSIEDAGYCVVDAADGEQALKIAESQLGRIAILVTDISLPKLKGAALAKTLLQRKPELKVVFMSGYSDQAIGSDGTLQSGTAFLQKPFSGEALISKMQELLADCSQR